MKRKRLLTLLIAFSFALVLFPDISIASPAQGFETQTVMVYIIGADLESDSGMATSDIKEMLKAKPDKERLNVLVMTGGTKQWKSNVIPADMLSVFKIEGTNPKLIHQWESSSMGEPAVLTRFLDYGVDNYPADSYGLVLWDHGGGPLMGFGLDTVYQNDALSLFELQEAMKASRFNKDLRLEWLAFDACLMASLEVAALLSDHAAYMIASQDTLPGRGFDYGFLSQLGQTRLTGPEVAQSIIDRTYVFYQEFAAKYPESQPTVTLSLTDLSKVGLVQQKLDQIFQNLDLGLQTGIYSDIARYRDNTKDYGRTSTTNDYDLIDLADFADNLAFLYPRQADELKQAVQDMVLFNRSNAPRTNGLSVYFPLHNKKMYSQRWGKLYQQFDITQAYRTFIEKFGKILLSDSLSSWTGSDAPAVTLDEVTGEYFIQLSPDQVKNYEKGQYYVLAQLKGEEFLLYYMSSDVTLDAQNRLRANFNGKTMFIEDPAGLHSIIPYMAEKENIQQVASYQIPVILTKNDNTGSFETVNAQLLAQIDKKKEIARITGAIKDEEAGIMVGKRDLDLSDFNSMYLVYNSSYLTRDENGDILPLGDWASADTPRVISFDTKGGFNVRYGSIPQGLYDFYVLMSIIDTQGNVSSSQLMPLRSDALPSAEVPTYQRPQAKIVTYPKESTQAVLLAEEHGIRITLSGMEQGINKSDSIDTSPALTLYLMIESNLDKDQTVEVDWLMLGGMMTDTPSYSTVPAHGSAVMLMEIPYQVSPLGPTLAQAGIIHAEDIRLRFTLGQYQGDLFSAANTQEIQILTDIDLSKGDQPDQPFTENLTLLIQEDGITIQTTGEPIIVEGELHIPLKISNNSQTYDRVRIAESSVNGIMASMQMKEDILPGSVRYTSAHIELERTILPPDLAEYQYMFDGLDNLEALGIDQVKEISLRFVLEAGAGEGTTSGSGLSHLTAPVSIVIPEMVAFNQTMDTAGEELFSGEGIQIVRLHSDPTGKKIYIHNSGPHMVHIASFGHVQADGQDYSENTPIYADVSSGKSAYVNLFGFLPGQDPEAKELSFYISIIDLEENRLMKQSDKITLLFPGTK